MPVSDATVVMLNVAHHVPVIQSLPDGGLCDDCFSGKGV